MGFFFSQNAKIEPNLQALNPDFRFEFRIENQTKNLVLTYIFQIFSKEAFGDTDF